MATKNICLAVILALLVIGTFFWITKTTVSDRPNMRVPTTPDNHPASLLDIPNVAGGSPDVQHVPTSTAATPDFYFLNKAGKLSYFSIRSFNLSKDSAIKVNKLLTGFYSDFAALVYDNISDENLDLEEFYETFGVKEFDTDGKEVVPNPTGFIVDPFETEAQALFHGLSLAISDEVGETRASKLTAYLTSQNHYPGWGSRKLLITLEDMSHSHAVEVRWQAHNKEGGIIDKGSLSIPHETFFFQRTIASLPRFF